MEIEVVPCLLDNYAYLVIAPSGETAVVDPSDAEPVLAALAQRKARLAAIWNTHHHWDHTGGNEDLCSRFPGIEVCGHASDRGRIPGQTRYLEEEDALRLGALEARVLHNPGHTLGAMTYLVEGAAFTGDTLFLAGCGRLFEGDPQMMFASLEKLASLPPETLVYPGHEYTLRNLEFALAVEPGHTATREKLREVERLRSAGRPSVPGTIALERATNPFLRAPSVERFAELRRKKDAF
jgi:hydroxyacylglutathione hydrolase